MKIKQNIDFINELFIITNFLNYFSRHSPSQAGWMTWFLQYTKFNMTWNKNFTIIFVEIVKSFEIIEDGPHMHL